MTSEGGQGEALVKATGVGPGQKSRRKWETGIQESFQEGGIDLKSTSYTRKHTPLLTRKWIYVKFHIIIPTL